MEHNADFSRQVVLHAPEIAWSSSPMAGVHRRMLDRIGDEVARATTIVRYAPGSRFFPHVHGGGEEFVVLEGVFQDEHGDYPVGSYVRNPPTSRHTPGSAEGCVIFVKLWQFDPADRTTVVANYTKMGRIDDPHRPGIAVTPLFEDARETVQIEVWRREVAETIRLDDGGEFLVLAGALQVGGEVLREQSWIRVPRGGRLGAVAGPHGARLWSKTRHLRFVDPPPRP